MDAIMRQIADDKPKKLKLKLPAESILPGDQYFNGWLGQWERVKFAASNANDVSLWTRSESRQPDFKIPAAEMVWVLR